MHFPTRPTQLAGPLLLLIAAFALFSFEPVSFKWLAYIRADLANWQVWRLLTSNLLHTNFNHLLLNSTGIALLWAVHGNHYRCKAFLTLFCVCSLFTCIGLWFFTPDMTSYVGLSGALHGLFAWGAIKDIQSGLNSGWLLLIGVFAKIAYEQWAGPSADISKIIDASVATDAHLYGFVGGLAFIGCSYLISQANRESD